MCVSLGAMSGVSFAASAFTDPYGYIYKDEDAETIQQYHQYFEIRNSNNPGFKVRMCALNHANASTILHTCNYYTYGKSMFTTSIPATPLLVNFSFFNAGQTAISR